MRINYTSLMWHAAVLAAVLLTATLAALAAELPRTTVWSVTLKPGVGSPTPYPSAERADSVLVVSEHNVIRIDGRGKVVFKHDIGDNLGGMPACGDVDGDGQAEVVAGTWRGHIECFTGAGKAKWIAETHHEFGNWGCVVIAPQAGGKLADVLIMSQDGWLTCLDGKGRYRWSFRIAGAGQISAPAVADLNGDGKPEYVCGIEGGIVAITGEGRLMWQYAEREEFSRQVAVIADADHNGKPEVYMLMNGPTTVVYALDGTDGKLLWRVPVHAKAYCALSTADINGDGFGEIVASDKYNDVIVFSHTGKQLWKTTVGGNGIFWSPVVADVDADGNLEIVVGVRHADINGTSLFVLDAEGNVRGGYPQGGEAGSPEFVADIDRDGALEVVSCSSDTVFAYRFGNPTKLGAVLWPCYRGNSELTGSLLPIQAAKGAQTRPVAAVRKGTLLPKAFDTLLGETKVSAKWTVASPALAYVEVSVVDPTGKRSTEYFPPQTGKREAELTIAFSHGGRYSIDARLMDGATGRALLEEKRQVDYVPLATEKRMAAAAVKSGGAESASLATASPQIGAELDRRRATLMARLESLKARVNAVAAQKEFPQVVIAAAAALRAQAAREKSFAVFARKVAASSPTMLFAVWNDADPWDYVDPRDELPAQTTEKVAYSAWTYGNQKEDFCWSMVGFNPDPISIRVEPGDLVGPDGAKEPWEKHLAFMQVQWMPTIYRPTEVPDMLPAMNTARTVQLAPGSFAQVWMVLDTKGLAPGPWTVPLHFQSLTMAAAAVDASLAVEVLPIELPYPYPWKMCNWAWPSAYPEPLRKKVVESLISHGSNVMYAPAPTRTCDGEGRLVGAVDWSALDSLVAEAKPGDPFLFFGGISLSAPAGVSEDSPAYKKAYKAWMQEFVAHLASIGVTYRDFAFYPVDEPGNSGHTGIEQFIRAAKKLREADPQAPIYADPAGGAYTAEWMREIDPWVDVWQPDVGLSGRPDLHAIMATRGRRLWMYQAPGEVRNLDTLAFYRRQPWTALRDGARGSGFWVYCQANLWGVGPNDEPSYGTVSIEPTGVVESRRWRAAHDGVQDVTAVLVLDDTIADAQKAGVDQALIDKAKQTRSSAVLAVAGRGDTVEEPARWGLLQKQRRLIADATLHLHNAIAAKRS